MARYEDQFEKPVRLNSDLPVVEKFDLALLPEALRPWVSDIQERMQCPTDFLAVGAMTALAGVVGNKVKVHPKAHDNWVVVPNLWGAMIGRPSIMKSPALSEILKPLRRLSDKARDSFDQQQAVIEVDIAEAQARVKQATKDLEKAIGIKGDSQSDKVALAKQELLDAKNHLNSVINTTERRYIINDPTVEALGVKLCENPNGLLLVRDELSGWIRSLDREDRSNDRAFYLECFNGNGSYSYDRIGRGTLHIENMTVSIIGGIQPSVLMPYIAQATANGTGNDGFAQRLQLAVYPDDIADWVNVDRKPDMSAYNRAYEVFEALDSLIPLSERFTELDGNGDEGLRFTPEAQAVFNSWRLELESRVRFGEMPPSLESHLSKYRSLMPSIALLLELADNPQALAVGEHQANKAVQWCQYLESHAFRLFHGEVSREATNAQLIFDRRERLPERFTSRDVHKKKWTGLSDVESVGDALSLLVDHHYIVKRDVETGGRPSVIYVWNPKINF